jgi:hypothetical protein
MKVYRKQIGRERSLVIVRAGNIACLRIRTAGNVFGNGTWGNAARAIVRFSSGCGFGFF